MATIDVARNEEGYLLDPSAWSEDVATAIAEEAHIELTPRHFEVIEFCRTDYEKTGKSPGVRRITKAGKIPTKEMYALFPWSVSTLAARAAMSRGTRFPNAG